jgi:hypothetical protein
MEILSALHVIASDSETTPFTTHYSPLTGMNYVRHLNAFFAFVRSDQRLTSSHVSLYMALFQYWNFNRFNNPFSIYRDNIMQLSKLSKNTYHKCIKELHEAKYIYYHQSSSKFQAVRISVVRLDKEEPPHSRFKQLDLFLPLEGVAQSAGGGPLDGHNIKTDSVANLSQHSPNIKTDTVTDLRHNIKPNIKQREIHPPQIFKKNKKIQGEINDLGHVSNMGHTGSCHPDPPTGGEGTQILQPEYTTVEEFFRKKNYPNTEATKFYNHYKALGWKIQGKTPIEDWKPLVEKWMVNANKWVFPSGGGIRPSADGGDKTEAEINYLYESFLEGKKIFHQITTAHFDQLKLQLDDEVIKQAVQERINQVSGTNKHSLNELWKAYLSNDPAHPLIQRDQPNRIALAKRIAVIKHFHSLKRSGSKELPP